MDDHFEESIEILINKRNKILNNSSRNRRYFHPYSVNNLVFHLADIKDENNKKWALNRLNDYLNLCEENINGIDRQMSRDIYYNQLYPLLQYYHDNLGFVQFDVSVFVLFYLFLIGVGYLIFAINGILIVIGILLIRGTFFYKKYKERKVFSLFY